MISRKRGRVFRCGVGAAGPVIRDEDQLVVGSGGLELLVERPDDMR
jgi:hypothetical protein